MTTAALVKRGGALANQTAALAMTTAALVKAYGETTGGHPAEELGQGARPLSRGAGWWGLGRAGVVRGRGEVQGAAGSKSTGLVGTPSRRTPSLTA
jgi:hypothetical protein